MILNMVTANHMITKAIYSILFKILDKKKVQIYSHTELVAQGLYNVVNFEHMNRNNH